MKKKLDSCESVNFRGGQILIHESKDHTIIEIHTKLGWRMSKFSPLVSEGNIKRNAKTMLHYSKQLYRKDKNGMQETAMKRE